MHPILEQPRRLGLYLFLAVQAGLLLAELLVRSAQMPRAEATLLAVPLLLAHAFSCLASWYLCRVLPLGVTPTERLLGTHLVAGLVASALATAMGVMLAHGVETLFPPTTVVIDYMQARTLVFVYSLLVFTLAVAVHYLFLAAEGRRFAERRAYEMRLLAREAELETLKAQINPHFLFNSLHSISSLVTSSPSQARAMCQGLADVLRQSLRLGARRSISLKEEMALAQCYLEVERVRFGDRLRVDIELEESCADYAVPPLLLQPLVENAVRHGIAHLLSGGTIRVRARRRGKTLWLEVENPCDQERPASHGQGIGLANVRRRLEAVFGDRATFSVGEQSADERRTKELQTDEQQAEQPAEQPQMCCNQQESRFRVALSLPCDCTLEVEARR